MAQTEKKSQQEPVENESPAEDSIDIESLIRQNDPANASCDAETGGAETVVSEPESEPAAKDDTAQTIESLAGQLEKQRDQYLRLMAEFDNYKRRMAREYDRIVEQANERLMLDIIGVRESLERAIAAAAATDGTTLSEGQKLITAQLDEALKKHGLSTFGAEGELFDPELHDALMRTAHDSIAADNIAQVFEKGYKLRNRIIRHAKVVVSSGPAEKKMPATTEESGV